MAFVADFIVEFRRAVAPELALLKGKPRLWGACLAIVAVPSVYSVTYLASVWDPYGHLGELPVALVNGDRGADFQGAHLDLGGQVMQSLEKKRPFRFSVLPSEAAARLALTRGQAYFALVIPANFTAQSLPGAHDGPHQLELLTAPGTSYSAALIGRRFGNEVAERVSLQLTEKRWAAMATSLTALKAGVRQLKSGASALDAGATTLQTGAGELAQGARQAGTGSQRLVAGSERLAHGVTRLTAGMGQVGKAVRLMAVKVPARPDLDRLASGSDRLAAGNRKLAQGLGQLHAGGLTLAANSGELARGIGALHAGSRRLATGSHQLTEGVSRVPLLGPRLAAGAQQVEHGAGQLASGLARAEDGSQRLSAGAGTLASKLGEAGAGARQLTAGQERLNGGVQRLTGGLAALGGGLRLMAGKLPADADLARLRAGGDLLAVKNGELARGLARLDAGAGRLAEGSKRLASGTHRLAAGLALLDAKLALAPDARTVKGLAAPVGVREVAVNSVASNGVAFAPYFMALSLWMGAVMTTFIFHFIKLPEANRAVGQRARMWSKGVLPGGIVLAQALCLATVLMAGMHVPVPHVASFFVICLAGSVTFLATLMALIMILGDAGKLVALILLVFQLGAAGGAYPVELTGGIFARAHPYLPISNMVSALRASMFGAYEGHWAGYVAAMLAFGWGAWLLALAVGRLAWKFTPDAAYSTVLDL